MTEPTTEPTTEPATLDIVRRARGLVANGWTTGDAARNADGFAVQYDSPQASQFCATGALFRAARDIVVGEPIQAGELGRASDHHLAAIKGIHALTKRLSGQVLSAWNDANSRTKEDVLGLFDEVIEKLEDCDD